MKKPIKKEKLVSYQCQRCKVIGLVIFGFILYKKQIDAILYLFISKLIFFF